ncbi:MAG: HAMP domain-containing methyl-accepting chemotaxis protein [Pseudomonadota bacterium]
MSALIKSPWYRRVSAKILAVVTVVLAITVGAMVAASVLVANEQFSVLVSKPQLAAGKLGAELVAPRLRLRQPAVVEKALEPISGNESLGVRTITVFVDGTPFTTINGAAADVPSTRVGSTTTPIVFGASGETIGALTIEWDLSKIDTALDKKTTALLTAGATAFTLGSILLLIYVRVVVGTPLRKLSNTIHALADGERDVAIAAIGRRDELGQIARAVDAFAKRLTADGVAAEADQARQLDQRKKERAAQAAALIKDFQESLSGVAEALGSAAEEINGVAGETAHHAEAGERATRTLAERAEASASRADESSNGVHELSKSIAEISEQINRSTTLNGQAVNDVRNVRDEMAQLSVAAKEISEVVQLITGIAEQTNLLALNATIEAARAGDAGKGFAVVAGEVKGLSNETSRATEEIVQKVDGIQQKTARTVAGVERIGTVIEELQGIAAAISAAMEEQGAVSAQVADNVQAVTEDMNTVSDGIANLYDTSRKSGEGQRAVQSSVVNLRGSVESLNKASTAFIDRIRAAA